MEKTISLSQDNPQSLPFTSFEPLLKYLKQKQSRKDNQAGAYKSVEDLFLTNDIKLGLGRS